MHPAYAPLGDLPRQAVASAIDDGPLKQGTLYPETLYRETLCQETLNQETLYQETLYQKTLYQTTLYQETLYQETLYQETLCQETFRLRSPSPTAYAENNTQGMIAWCLKPEWHGAHLMPPGLGTITLGDMCGTSDGKSPLEAPHVRR